MASIPAAVGKKNREHVGGARWLAVDGDKTPPRAGKRLENAAVVRLKPHTSHRARQPELRKIPRRALQRSHSGPRASTCAHPAPRALAGGAERPFDERSCLGTFRGDIDSGLGRDPAASSVKPLWPGNVLENPDGESGRLDVNHERGSIMGV